MEKWLIQGENAPNCHEQASSPFGLVRANLRGESLGTGLLICYLIFCKNTQKTAAKLSWTACKHTAKTLGKDSFNFLEGPCSVSVRKMKEIEKKTT
jgi:hypothetical protein